MIIIIIMVSENNNSAYCAVLENEVSLPNCLHIQKLLKLLAPTGSFQWFLNVQDKVTELLGKPNSSLSLSKKHDVISDYHDHM